MFNKNSLVRIIGCSDERLHFGLNDTTMIDAIVVNWPVELLQKFMMLTLTKFY